MITGLKRPVFIVSFLLFCAAGLKAQQNHFIYLQTDNKQPFYVKLDKQLYSSTASGYLILSKLPEGRQELKIGFPKNEWPEQSFTCNINKKDLGYIIKNLSKGWGLLNMQTGEITLPGNKAPEPKAKAKEISNDEFSRLLADVVDDPAIRQTGEEISTVSNNPEQPLLQNAVMRTNTISKLGEKDNNNGRHITYIDKDDQQVDTVQVFIPVILQGNLPDKGTVETGDEKKPAPAAKPLVTMPPATDKKATVTISSTCKKIATDNEVILLKKKMFGEKTEEDKLGTAAKAFNSKCFTTAQVMSLASLFPGDAGRYKLFNSAYAHTSDKEKYPALKAQLKDARYISLFNAML